MTATLTQTINLVIEIGILMMTIVAYLAFRKKKYMWHGQLMTIAFAMLIASFLLVMVPSLQLSYNTFFDPGTVVFDVASIVHIPFGIAGLGLGGYFIARWARNDYKLNNMKSTFLMRITIISWIGNVILGAIIYFTMPS